MNGSTNEKYGLAKSLSVMPGDTVNLQVYGKYIDSDDNNWTSALTTLMGQIAGNTAGVVVDGASYSTSTSSFPFTGLLSTSGSSGGPKAYLNWLIFDRNFVLITGGYMRMSAAPAEHGQNVAHEKLSSPDLVITEPGYVYAYLSNEETTPVEVYFDDFKVTHKHSSNVAGGDYYPFGLVMNERQITQEPYRFGYQGQYAEKDSLSGWNMFELRMYDARIGRWMDVDPYGQYASPYTAMGNAPHMSIDPDGGFNWGATFVGTVGGFAVGSLVGLAVDKDNWWKYGIGGAVIGGTIGAMQPDLNIPESASGLTEFRAEVEYAITGKAGVVREGRDFYHYGRAATLSDGPPAYFYTLIKHGVWDPKNGDWGKLDGHVFLLENDGGRDHSFRPTGTRNGKTLPPDLNKSLWNSDGHVGSDPRYVAYARSVDHDVYRIRTTAAKKKLLLQNIGRSTLDPPNYSFIGKRCAGWAMKMMRQSKIVGSGSKFHQYSPISYGKYLSRRPGVTKVP